MARAKRQRSAASRFPIGRIVLKLIGAVIALILLYQAWLFGWVVWYNFFPPRQTAVMSQELKRLRADEPDIRLRYQWVDYSAISPHLKRAVIAAEDARFLAHGGVDWEAIEKAFEHNRTLAAQMEKARQQGTRAPQRVMRGGSTLTQQVAKNLFLSNSRSYLRKGQELVIAYMLEAVMSKQRILELYLNIAEMGEGVFGAEAAARHYFGASAKALSPHQAARLAALLPNPRYYDKHRQSAYWNTRTQTLLRRMSASTIP